MAKRSDFAQKLLDDLRLRKERMAASQSSKSSKPMAADAYAYRKQKYQGSRETQTNQTVSNLRQGGSYNRSTTGSKSIPVKEASNGIVPFSRGQRAEPIGNLSMALAFALENRGKIRRVDSPGGSGSILSFLNQFGRKSMNTNKMERSVDITVRTTSGRFPTISEFQIQEISRGADKLNQILRACSNGLNFDGYSIEIGKELLKGALDLEESLRMIVNLQEASDYMIKPQSKSRITLLDEDEEDNDGIVNEDHNKQLDLPRFSFDKPSRSYHHRQKTIALPYPSDAFSTSSSGSHRRSTSYAGAVSRNIDSNLPPTKQEKARIPSVIVKLMGLEELPDNNNSKSTTKRDSSLKQKVEGKPAKKNPEGSGKPDPKRRDLENHLPATRKQNQSQLEKDIAPHLAVFEVKSTVDNAKATHRGMKPPRSSDNDNTKTEKHLKHTMQTQNQTKAATTLKSNGIMAKTEKKETNKLVSTDLPGIDIDNGFHHHQRIREAQEWRQKAGGIEQQQSPKHKFQQKKQKMNEAVSGTSLKSLQDGATRNSASTESTDAMQLKGLSSDRHNEYSLEYANERKNILPGVVQKTAYAPVLVAPKVKIPGVQKDENPRKINELVLRRSGSPLNLALHKKAAPREVKKRELGQTKGAEQGRAGRSKEVKSLIAKSNKPIASIQQSKTKEETVIEAAADTKLNSPLAADNCECLNEQQNQTRNESRLDVTSSVGNDQDINVDEYRSHTVVSNPLVVTKEETDTMKDDQKEPEPEPEPERAEPLTQNENNLKHILVKSQVFMNTAEALFKLQVPFNILGARTDDSLNDCQVEEGKLMLDCGYEVMRRKGKLRELTFQASIKKLSLTATATNKTTKPTTLNDLARELYRDIEKLRFCGQGSGSGEDCLVTMLEKDLYNGDPELNCMWDFGWDNKVVESTLLEKDDVAREMEKHIINGLLDEVTRELVVVF